VIGTVITFIAFWTKLSDRITIADQKAEGAQQEAAEAKNDLANFRDALDHMTRDFHEQMNRMQRDDGEGLAAIRQKITEVELFMRDNFVRNVEFTSAMTEIKAGQLRTESKLDRLFGQMRGG
jgi:molecular chaperone GrpE (heat shock protein)